MHSVNLYQVTEESAKWRDLDVNLQKGETAFHICMPALTVILLVGMAVGIYYCQTSTVNLYYHPYTQYTALIAILGGGGAIGVVALQIIFRNFQMGMGREEEHNEELHQRLVDLMAKGELKDVYAKYYRKNGGLNLLVRQGYLLPKQADRLRELFKEYKEAREVMDDYEGQTHIAAAIGNSRFPAKYAQAFKEVRKLNKEWRAIRTELCEQYKMPAPEAAPEEQDYEILNYQLKEPTSEAKAWRDLTAAEQNQELAGRISLVAGILVLAAGMAVAFYFCATRTFDFVYQDAVGNLMHRIESTAIFSLFPAILGGVPLIIMLITLPFINRERGKHRWEDNIHKDHLRDDRILFLTESRFDEFMNFYYKKHGGLGPLVRGGFLTVEQGNTLRKLFRRYKSISNLRIYSDNNDPFIAEVQKKPENFPAYNTLIKRKAACEADWAKMQEEMKRRFLGHDEEKIEVASGLSVVKTDRPAPHLPSDALQHIFSYLPLSDLQGTHVNSQWKKDCIRSIESRKKHYLLTDWKKSYRLLSRLVGKYIPETCIVPTDPEATLRNLELEDQEELKFQLGKALVAYVNDIEMVKLLLFLDANLEERHIKSRATPLMLAEKVEVAELLIEAGADVNALNHNKYSPLMGASHNAHLTELLLKKGAGRSINHKFSNGSTALHFAAQKNNIDVVRLLLDAGADKQIANNRNQTAVDLAKDEKVIDLILTHEIGL